MRYFHIGFLFVWKGGFFSMTVDPVDFAMALLMLLESKNFISCYKIPPLFIKRLIFMLYERLFKVLKVQTDAQVPCLMHYMSQETWIIDSSPTFVSKLKSLIIFVIMLTCIVFERHCRPFFASFSPLLKNWCDLNFLVPDKMVKPVQ